ncbi:MAG: hypothetical protein ACI8T1_003068 [Verrucomicrobiales bacterium]|jgi:hypothetical protein
MTETISEVKPLRWGWTGLPIVVVAMVTYIFFFSKFPVTRDFPWVNLPLCIIGLVVSVFSFRRALKGSVTWRKVVHSQLFVFSFLFTALFITYVFYLSWVPPVTAVTETLENPADITLTDHTGQSVSLSDFKGKNLIVTFYRGHW